MAKATATIQKLMIKNIIIAALSLAVTGICSAGPEGKKVVTNDTLLENDQIISFGPLAINSSYAKELVNWQQNVTEKPYLILKTSQAGGLKANTLTVSGAAWGTWMHEETNVPGKFPILSRFPDQHGSVDSQASRWILNNAAVALTGRVGNWVTLFGQGEFSDIEFLGQDQYQLRKAIVMVGNLDEFPVYAYFGRNTVDFGSMDSYSPFTHTVNNHSFRVDSDDPVVALGFAPSGLEGLNLVATAIPGGRHLRVADSEGSGQFDNYALNGSYRFDVSDEIELKVGGGWLNSTIYNRSIPHHPGGSFTDSVAGSAEAIENGAWDVNAELMWRKFSFGGEYTATANSWPATDTRVSSLTGQLAYDFRMFDKATRFSFVYGINTQGQDGTEHEELRQIAVGLETKITDRLSLGIEYVRNTSFVPLIAITQVSDSDVETDSVIIGGKFTF